MTTTEKMNLDERYKYLRIMRQQYRQAQTRRAKQEQGPEYGPDVDTTLALIWEAQDYICAERLQPVLVFTAEQLAKHGVSVYMR